MTTANTTITRQHRSDAHLIWDYHQMGHHLTPCDVAIGLGSHDLGVAEHAAKLYHDGLFPLLVFTGATSPTSAPRFPRGEAVHYREPAPPAKPVRTPRARCSTRATTSALWSIGPTTGPTGSPKPAPRSSSRTCWISTP